MSEPHPTIVLPYLGQSPEFHGAPEFCGARTAVLGRTSVGGGLILGARASIRADGHDIRAGEAFCLGARSTIHIAHGTIPTLVGSHVAVASNVIIHACTIADDVAVEDDVVILDGALVESRTIIAKGSVVFPRAHLQSGGLWAGLPARRVRDLAPGELAPAQKRIRAQTCNEAPGLPAGIDHRARLTDCGFVAPTARIVGAVNAGEAASVWFGCEIDAGNSTITIGARANIQDNSEIRCPAGPVTIGCDSTLGHNVRVESCTIGDQSLVGNGAVVRAGTIVEDRVLVAAGAITDPGQRLESGWLWGGRPARRLSALDGPRMRQITAAIGHYLEYSANFRDASA